MARFRIAPERSTVWIHGSSSLHPIDTRTNGLEGFVDLELDGGLVDLASPVTARLSFPVARLSSGNPVQDREMRRRIEARRHPSILGVLTDLEATDNPGDYLVSGDLEFRGVSRPCQDVMHIEPLDPRTVRLGGESTFDIRDFGMEPPRILLLRVEPEVRVRVEIVAALDR